MKMYTGLIMRNQVPSWSETHATLYNRCGFIELQERNLKYEFCHPFTVTEEAHLLRNRRNLDYM